MISEYKNENLIVVLDQYARDAIDLYRQKLNEDNKNATFNLNNNIDYIIEEGEDEINVYLYLEDYWKYVEKGTKPHFPPIKAIEDWIVAKPILPRPSSNGKLPTTKQLAFLIARKISEVGTEGGFYLENTVKELEQKYAPLIAEAIDKDCSNWVMENIEKLF